MENTVALGDLFATTSFIIPKFQRAYSWEVDQHLQVFVEDLRELGAARKTAPEKDFFMGTLLLHQEDREGPTSIVDGQQRLTTVVTFVAAGLELYEQGRLELEQHVARRLKRKFIYSGSHK